VFLAGLTAALCVSAAYAKDCEIRPSELDGFAQYRLGPLKAMPKDVKRLAHCAVYPKHHAYDCEFVDAEGTHYIAADHDIAKIVRRARTSPNLPASYPLKFGMKVEEAHRILSAMDPKIDFSSAGAKGKGYDIDTGQCLKNSLGVEYWLTAHFDKDGRLNRLEAAFETSGD
jgi:hypothetical protein